MITFCICRLFFVASIVLRLQNNLKTIRNKNSERTPCGTQAVDLKVAIIVEAENNFTDPTPLSSETGFEDVESVSNKKRKQPGLDDLGTATKRRQKGPNLPIIPDE